MTIIRAQHKLNGKIAVGMISQAKILASMCWFEAQRFKVYPLEIIGTLAARLAELALYGTFWLVVSHFSNSSIQPKDIISFYLIASGMAPFFNLGYGAGAQIIEHIKSGKLSQSLLHPANPILYPWAIRTGRNFINIIFGALQVIAGVVIAGSFNPAAIPFFIPVLINTFVINLAFNTFVGTMGFHLTDARGFKNAILHLSTFARGERMPLFLMTPALANILLLTPFPASQYHLTILLQGIRMPSWQDVFVGMLWAVILILFTNWFWQRSLKKYEAVGL